MKKSLQKTVAKCFAAFVFAFACTLLLQMPAFAKDVDDTQNGVHYDDTQTVTVGYVSNYNYGGGAYTYIRLDNDGDRIANVKSGSANLLAKKTVEDYSKSTSTDYDYDTDKNVTVTTTRYYYTYISFFAKKKGTYKVSFDVLDSRGNIRCKKTITVTAVTSSSTESPVKSIKYRGKDLYTYYPYTTAASGKLSVKLKKGYQLVSIEIGKQDSSGEYVYTKVKNNKTIKLAKKSVYTREYNYQSGGYKYQYDLLFPHTQIRITYLDKNKEEQIWYDSLYTLNKKSTLMK